MKRTVHKIAEISKEEIVMSLLNKRGKYQSAVPSYVTRLKPRREPFPQ